MGFKQIINIQRLLFSKGCYSPGRLLQIKIFIEPYIEELLKIRGITVDHGTFQRWVFMLIPIIDVNFRKRKRAVGLRCHLDEAYIKVKGKWCYLYRAVDKEGKTIDFLLTHLIIKSCPPILDKSYYTAWSSI